MKTKPWLKVLAATGAATLLAVTLTSCNPGYTRDKDDQWKTKFDITNPDLQGAGTDTASANAQGWYVTLDENFDGDTLPAPFTPSPHGLRRTEYWCDQMVSVQNGNVVIKAAREENHQCEVCGTASGNFTSGIDTSMRVDGKSVPLFEQAFGYFEARVKFPESGGMWSAFWLQIDNMTHLGYGGEDGAEIDIYESSFYHTKRNKMGHAVHYDGYNEEHRCQDTIRDAGKDLYDGFHTFAVKWTPSEYVFYIDNEVSWASDFGGVSKVPAYLRLTNEVRGREVGPYGQWLGKFKGGEFLIDYVKVYQNVNYLDSIKTPADFA